MAESPASPLPDPKAVPADPAFATLAGLAGFGVMLVGHDGTIHYCSPSAEKALGAYGATRLRAMWPRLLADRHAHGEAAVGLIETGAPGRAADVRVEAHALPGAGERHLVLVEAPDEAAEAQLRLANLALTHAHLASALLHEINAPLNNVKLTLALCEATLARAPADAMPADLRARLQRYFEVVGGETSRLVALLEELRRMSGGSGDASETFDLAGLAADIARLMRHEATIRGIRLVVQPADEALPARADRRAVLLALVGIVVHLVEQTAAEGIVSVSLSRASGAEACFRIETSPAVAADATRDALDRVAVALRRRDLPLAAARAQIEAVRGAVRATERDGRLCVTVCLPLAT